MSDTSVSSSSPVKETSTAAPVSGQEDQAKNGSDVAAASPVAPAPTTTTAGAQTVASVDASKGDSDSANQQQQQQQQQQPTQQKNPNVPYRTGGGKRMMMTGYRPMYPPMQMKSEICEEFTKGTCSRGSRCPFLHVAPPGSSKALAMTRGNMAHNNAAKTATKGSEPQADGTKSASKKKKKKKNAAKKAQEKAAEGTDAAATTAATTAPTTAEGDDKNNAPNQNAKTKKAKNQRRQAPADGTGAPADAAATTTAAAASTAGQKQNGRKHRAQGGAVRQNVTMMSAPNAVFVNYVLGACRYGRNCEFLHPEGPVNPAGMICPFYAAGSCGYGLSCIFAHVLPTDRAYHMKPCLMNRTGHCPNGDGCVFYHEKPNPARALDSRSTIPCSFWVRGYCAKGEKCPFAHPDEYWAYQSPFERVPISGDESKKDQSNKPEEGTTRESEPAVPKSQIACKFWAQGNCPLGDKCEYRHDLFLHTRT